MPTAKFTLKGNQVLAIANADSETGMILLDSGYTYGRIMQVNDLCDMYAFGDYIIFNPQAATQFTYNDTIYYIIPYDQIILTETLIP